LAKTIDGPSDAAGARFAVELPNQTVVLLPEESVPTTDAWPTLLKPESVAPATELLSAIATGAADADAL
jgi:hypothetical protein